MERQLCGGSSRPVSLSCERQLDLPSQSIPATEPRMFCIQCGLLRQPWDPPNWAEGEVLGWACPAAVGMTSSKSVFGSSGKELLSFRVLKTHTVQNAAFNTPLNPNTGEMLLRTLHRSNQTTLDNCIALIRAHGPLVSFCNPVCPPPPMPSSHGVTQLHKAEIRLRGTDAKCVVWRMSCE